ncbi:phage minor capsid protein [Actinoplanes sp. NPDC049599]|uniref:phage minor capsid protein n=1 Tax=Actinoplanes sp. NPDC049599 TaxID=3363903 RepID=UPI0037A6D587
MSVTPDQIAEISRATVDLYRAAEGAILREVTRRLDEGQDAPDWAVTRLGAVSTLRRTVDQVLQLVLATFADGIRAALARAYRGGQAAATADVPAQFLPRDSDAVRAAGIIAEQLPRAGVIENLAVALVQDVGARHSNVVRNVVDAYRKVIAEATAVSVAGGMTRRQASQHAYQKLVDQGLTIFTDVRGRRWRLSSYVEMGVRTVTQRAAVQGQVDRQTRLGLPFVIVSNEVQECFLCRPYEGRVLRIDADGPAGVLLLPHAATGAQVPVHVLTTLDDARSRGFQHPNCRHSVRTYLPGVTKLPPRGTTADKQGDEARQRQRAIERTIRRYKERELAALTPEGKAAAKAKVRLWQSQMRDHLAANPALKRLTYREQIGAGNIPASARPAPAAPSAPAPAPAPPPASPPLPQRRRATAPPAPVDDLPGILALDLSLAANREVAREAFSKVIGGDYAGLRVEVESAEAHPYYGHNEDISGPIVNGVIYPEGEPGADPIGRVMRGFYRDEDGALVAVHAYLALTAKARGKGFATAFNGHLERWYRQQGIVRIEVHANIDVGGYTWATQGYGFADHESADDVLARLRFVRDLVGERMDLIRAQARAATGDRADRLNAGADKLETQLELAAAILERAETEPFGSDRYPTAYEISQCGRSSAIDGGTWVGKEAMLGSDWQGVKWL